MNPEAHAISTKVLHEWKMFEYVFQQIQDRWKSSEESQKNIMLEAFLLHARVLRDFFLKDPEKDDVSAAHFFENPESWSAIKIKYCPCLQRDRMRLNKYLSHLTYGRMKEDKGWNIYTIYTEISKAWRDFHSMLGPEQKEWFKL